MGARGSVPSLGWTGSGYQANECAFIPWVFCLILAGSSGILTSCTSFGVSTSPSDEIRAELQSSDPERPEFELRLQEGRSFAECLLAIDKFIYPKIEVDLARRRFEALCRESERELARRPGESSRGARPDQAAEVFLRTLSRNGFKYDLVQPRSAGEPDARVVSYTLLHGSGCCATFSLLCEAFLDRMTFRSSVVCLPDHCFVRVWSGGSFVDVETTDLDAPLRGPLGVSSEECAKAGTHYGEPLDQRSTLWHYYADRLWSWVAWRSTDCFTLIALEKAGSVLNSTCQSFEAHAARRHFLRAKDRELASNERDGAWNQALRRYQKLHEWEPGEPDFVLSLTELYVMRGQVQEALPALKRFAESSAPKEDPDSRRALSLWNVLGAAGKLSALGTATQEHADQANFHRASLMPGDLAAQEVDAVAWLQSLKKDR